MSRTISQLEVMWIIPMDQDIDFLIPDFQKPELVDPPEDDPGKAINIYNGYAARTPQFFDSVINCIYSFRNSFPLCRIWKKDGGLRRQTFI